MTVTLDLHRASHVSELGGLDWSGPPHRER